MTVTKLTKGEMIEYGIQPEELYIIQSLGLLAMAFSKAIRAEVYRRQKGRCHSCDDHFKRFEVHHRYPRAMTEAWGLDKSFVDSIENAVGLCPPPPVGNGCHREADELAFKGIIYPQVFFTDPDHDTDRNEDS